MDPIAPSDTLHPGDVVHHPVFGFAVVTRADDRGALLRWLRQSQGHPQRVSRRTLGNAYRRAQAGGIIARSIDTPESVREATRAEPLAALGQLLLEFDRDLDRLQVERWMHHLAGDDGFAEWFRALTALASADPRFQSVNFHLRLAPDVDPEDLVFPASGGPVAEPARERPTAKDRRKGKPVAPGRVDHADAFAAGRALAGLLASVHAERKSVSRAEGAIVARSSGWSLETGPGFEPQADVAAGARALLGALVGALPSPEVIDEAELCDIAAGVAPEVPLELWAVLQQALGGNPSLRPRDGGELAVMLGVAEAVSRARADLPVSLSAGLVGGFDTHIGVAKSQLGQVNQDHFLLAGEPDLACFAIADGISTATAGSGDLASLLLVRALRLQWATHHAALRGGDAHAHHAFLQAALERANTTVCEAAARVADGDIISHLPMGTTVVAGTSRGNRVHLAALGDSRAWLVGRHGAAPLLHDHNLHFQYLQEAAQGGQPPSRSGGYALIGYAGHWEYNQRPLLPPTFTRTFNLLPGEWLVLATDGFSDYGAEGGAAVSRLVAKTCAEAGPNPGNAEAMAVARTLVDAANAGGGGDNITVLALTLGPATSAASEPS